jgi:hypothetical protein
MSTTTWPDPATEPTIGMDRACRLLGIGRNLGYELAGRGEFPVPVIRCGKLFRVPTAALVALLAGTDAASA